MARFKVGDKVEVIGGAGLSLAFQERIGEHGVITKIKRKYWSDKRQVYFVKFDKGFQHHNTLIYLNTSLRHSKEKRVLDILRKWKSLR